jgi:hypothetical protein
MSPALRFREEMEGFVAFGDHAPEAGHELGRREGTTLRLRLTVIVDDVDRLIAGPDRRTLVRGQVDFPELGGSFPIERGHLWILPSRPNQRTARMDYVLGVRTDHHGRLTVRGAKHIAVGTRTALLRAATTVDTWVVAGEPDFTAPAEGPPSDRVVASGRVRLTLPRIVASMGSFRPRARSRVAGGKAIVRFWAAVAGGLTDPYARRLTQAEDERSTPAPELSGSDAVAAGRRSTPPPEEKLAYRTGSTVRELRVRPFNLEDGTGSLSRVQNVTQTGVTPHREPVLLIAGSSVGAEIFRPQGVDNSIVTRLIDEGYDVWVENWRGSLDHEPSEYSLDEAAVLDHPRALAFVAEETGAKELKAVVHCLGSSSFMLSLASGLLDRDDQGYRVTRVVSNAVSLHPVVPRGSERKLRGLIPVFNRLTPYFDPQWARHPDSLTDKPAAPAPAAVPPNVAADLLVRWTRLQRGTVATDVSSFAQFMYGSGHSTLYEERMLEPATREWMRNQLAWAPMRLYRQIARSVLAGHLVPMREWDGGRLHDIFSEGPHDNGETKVTFMTGAANRCFAPISQQRTFEWFSAYQPKRHAFVQIPGYGHLDVWLRRRADEVHEVVLKGLES